MPDLRWCSVAGLVLAIIGAVMVWAYGLPKPSRRAGAIDGIAERTDLAEQVRARRYDGLAWIGLALLIAGFVLQLIGAPPSTPPR
jgi:hypothetical protein